MKSRTSFFNPTVLKKDITRFAPVWGLYSLFVLLFVLLLWETEPTAARFMNTAPSLFQGMGVVNFLYASLVALLLFGDLFQGRVCNMLHAMPLRREGWFLTHLTAGMLFFLVPNGIAALLTAALLQEYSWAAFLWLGLMLLQYLFFFGAATFSALCAGSRLGALTVYGILNFLAVIVGWFVITFYQPLLYGLKMNFYNFAKYSPIIRFCNSRYLQTHFDNMTHAAYLDRYTPGDWQYLGIAAGVGVVLLGLALLIYRRRQLEYAGDLIAFKPAAPVFLVIYTLCAGAVLYFIAEVFAPALSYIFLAVGFAIGFFTGKMLLERKVRVFRGKNLLAFGALAVAFAISLGLTALDPIGVTRYVPEKEQVSSVKLCASHYVYDLQRSAVLLTKDEDIERVLSIHQDCIDRRTAERGNTLPLYVCYALENGAVVERYYYVELDSQGAKYLQNYFSAAKTVFNGKDPSWVLENLQWLECYSYEMDRPCLAVSKDPDELNIDYYKDKYGDTGSCTAYALTGSAADDPILAGLFDAIVEDCQAGRMAQAWEFFQDRDTVATLSLQCKSNGYTTHITINCFADCENTVAYLNALLEN